MVVQNEGRGYNNGMIEVGGLREVAIMACFL